MRNLTTVEAGSVAGGYLGFSGHDEPLDEVVVHGKTEKTGAFKGFVDLPSGLDEIVAYGRRMLGSYQARFLVFLGLSSAAEVAVREVINQNGDVIEEVEVVADKIDPSDVPPASVLFGGAGEVSPSERMEYWQQALKNMSPEELRLIAQDLEALKMKSEVTAALDAIITQVQASLKAAAHLPPDQRAMFASSIAQNIGFNTTLINWSGLGCWWGPR